MPRYASGILWTAKINMFINETCRTIKRCLQSAGKINGNLIKEKPFRHPNFLVNGKYNK